MVLSILARKRHWSIAWRTDSMTFHYRYLRAILMFDRSKNKPTGTPTKGRDSAYTGTVAPSPSSVRSVTMIGPNSIIKGEIAGDEDIVIEGRVEGIINLHSNQVSIGESGNVRADIHARVIKIDGTIIGDMCASENVMISKSGNVSGNIVAPRVTLEDGAIFKGSIDMDPAGIASKEVPGTSQPLTHSAASHMASPGLDLKSV